MYVFIYLIMYIWYRILILLKAYYVYKTMLDIESIKGVKMGICLEDFDSVF